MADDLQRYIEYLQGTMLSANWEHVYQPTQAKKWLDEASRTLPEVLKSCGFSQNPSLADHFQELANGFYPKTRFDLPFTGEIFGPFLKRIQSAAADMGVHPKRPIELVTSTDIGPSPMARPSGGTHLLFIGLGTSVFCNYWSKVLATLVMGGARREPDRITINPDSFKANTPAAGLLLACRLALFYAFNSTLMGFGTVHPDRRIMPYRAQLLEAMEIFVLSHEFAHFVAQERFHASHGMLRAHQERELERFCDILGLTLCREAAKANFLAFAGIGAISVFRAVHLCESSRDLILSMTQQGTRSHVSDVDHPPLEKRIKTLRNHLQETTADDQRDNIVQFVQEYDSMVQRFNIEALKIVTQAVSRISSKALTKQR